MHNDHPRLFFVHIPKTGGMTFHAIIERQYEPEEIITVPSVENVDEVRRSIQDEWTPERKARVKVVKGHMPYGWHTAFGNDSYEYITIMRHPVERILSFYSFAGAWHPEHSDSLHDLLAQSPQLVSGDQIIAYTTVYGIYAISHLPDLR